ncbi:SpoIID/LytB domain-containing protein [Cyanobium sp. PCC 7001]|uniref:SpoIID/LytB domain-containing protein n=1 Tax=Cyanobium sp. PCC 7001 TaxID=180281 RepID=UPI001CEDC678|nr:SpoIID/LytB domain-containing protein [Cyanobium sp. PCC 7001]
MAFSSVTPWQASAWRPSVLLPVVLAAPVVALAGSGAASLAQQGDPEVRVLLASAAEISVRSLQRPLVLRAEGGASPALLELPPTGVLQLRLTKGRVRLTASGVDRILPVARSYWLELKPGQSPADTGTFQLQQRHYRGRLQVRPEGAALQAINHIALETYLPSVVGSEMPPRWPQAALRAQAVAARTYALRQRKPRAAFDLTATVTSQVYKGVESETDSTREAVASTRGQVLMYRSSLANTVFHSSSGGRTENSGDIWSQQLPYLVSVPDFDQRSPVHQWEKPLPPDLLRQAFREIGGVKRIDVVATTATGRVRQARVIGPVGTLVVTGPELRSRLGLRSTQVRFEVLEPPSRRPAAPESRLQQPGQGPWGPITPPPPVMAVIDSASGALAEPVPALAGSSRPASSRPSALPSLVAIGRGFGHGVGMSQWGALALAEQGQSHERILSHYFRGTELRRYSPP